MEGDGLVSDRNTLTIKSYSLPQALPSHPSDGPKLLSQESTQSTAADRGNQAVIVVFTGLRRKKKRDTVE